MYIFNMKFINVLFLFFQVCLGYVIKGFLDEGVLPLSPEELSSTSVQLLSDSQMGELPFQETGVRADDGYFVFSNVTKGDYLLVFNSIFLANKDETYKVSVREKVTVNKVFDGHDYRKDLGPLVEYPIVIGPLHKQKYFKARESFALFQLVKNPMMLLSIASLGMVFFLPKLTESEEFKQYQEESKQAKGKIQQAEAQVKAVEANAAPTSSSTPNKTGQVKKRR